MAFYVLLCRKETAHSLTADGNQHIWISEKMLEFSSAALFVI